MHGPEKAARAWNSTDSYSLHAHVACALACTHRLTRFVLPLANCHDASHVCFDAALRTAAAFRALVCVCKHADRHTHTVARAYKHKLHADSHVWDIGKKKKKSGKQICSMQTRRRPLLCTPHMRASARKPPLREKKRTKKKKGGGGRK